MKLFRDRSLNTAETRALWIAGLVWAAIAVPFAGTAEGLEIVIQHPGGPEADMPIGGDLEVGFTQATPLAKYTVLLLDEDDFTVASRVIRAGSGGQASPQVLWHRSGIVGCDPGAFADPDLYRFTGYDEAESVLDGRSFRIEIYEGTDPDSWNLETDESVGFVMENPEVRAFAADGSGCLRTIYYNGEDVYLSIQHNLQVARPFRIFTVAPQKEWEEGDPLVDLRPGGSNALWVTPGAPTVGLLWVNPDVPTPGGEFEIIVRWGMDPTPTFDPSGDFSADRPSSPGGTYNECTLCTLPDNNGGG